MVPSTEYQNADVISQYTSHSVNIRNFKEHRHQCKHHQ